MPILNEKINTLTENVVSGQQNLEQALAALDDWIRTHGGGLSENERRTFSASLDQESTDDDRSLVDSILKLHTTRLLYRYDRAHIQPPKFSDQQSPYGKARVAFVDALSASEEGINEARIDVAVANAHQLLKSPEANRRWLDYALDRLPALASADMVALAEAIPAMPLPRLNVFKRLGLKVVGFNFERLAQENRDSMVTIARMQENQIVLLAHLVGTSFEAIREWPRANRAYRSAAHLIVRRAGMFRQEAEQLLDIAETIRRVEPEAAQILARQARPLCQAHQDTDGLARADAILTAS
ncbi:MAG: hypothetical protein HY866_10255 [Chloroflexi bacterium]|nr:hypothetical protein [Chloroflexota bacterium]